MQEVAEVPKNRYKRSKQRTKEGYRNSHKSPHPKQT